MKKAICMSLSFCLLAGLTGCEHTGVGKTVFAVIFLILGFGLLALAALRTWQFFQYRKRLLRRQNNRRKIPTRPDNLTLLLYGVAVVLLVMALVFLLIGSKPQPSGEEIPQDSTPPTEPPVVYEPEKTAYSDPINWGIEWEIFKAGTQVSAYNRPNPITFDDPADYFKLPGVATFRGNNYRDSATYGTATVTEQTLTTLWSTPTQALAGGADDRSWSGSGWTGQPLIVKWDDATKQQMNLYPEKKAKEDLVEIIYATLDGHIYFLDLEDGSSTRDTITIGMALKGAGSLDPRGWPLMYVGAGDGNTAGERPKMFVISLIDGTILFEHGENDPLALREDNDNWSAYDSAPLVDAETDTLIWPGENGLLYTFRLNTVYDRAAGTISVNPDAPVQTRYRAARSSKDTYWLGYESSVSIVDRYLYISENGGMFFCIDLDTMELVWAQDTRDDSNSSPVIERVAKDEAYIYTAPSLHWTQNANANGTIYIYKLDAITGEIVWQTPYQVHTVNLLSGGVQSTPVLGKPGSSIEGLVIYSISRIPDVYTGVMVALDTKTGEEIWRLDMANYTWSSPVAFYEEDGTAYIAVCDSVGDVTLVEGATGKVLDTASVGSLVEASPAVYEDMLIIGTRGMLICGVQIK